MAMKVAMYDTEQSRRTGERNSFWTIWRKHFQRNSFRSIASQRLDWRLGEWKAQKPLVRWIHPEYGFMPPDSFIPVFEENGFIWRLDYYVSERVCQKIREWMDEGKPVVPISVNLSRRDF
ncbi:MAG: EAL domain-containing protein [Coprococcus sp.]